MNTLLSIKIELDEVTRDIIPLLMSKKIVTFTYKPSDFQSNSSFNKKTIKNLLDLGNNGHLSNILTKLNTLIQKNIIIGNQLKILGFDNINPELENKKFNINNIINMFSYHLFEKFSTILTNTLVKNINFYDFSLGIIKNTTIKIEKELDETLIKIKRKINTECEGKGKVFVNVESIDGYNTGKTGIFSFNDSYNFDISQIGGCDFLTKTIIKVFNKSIEPFADIYMEKIICDVFKNIRSSCSIQHNVYLQMERLAYEIYSEQDTKKEIKESFQELCVLFHKIFNDFIPYSLPESFQRRQVTVTTSFSDFSNAKLTKFDFKNFNSYHNSYQHKINKLKKDGLELPKKLDIDEIKKIIMRTKRYYIIHNLSNSSFSNFIESIASEDNFETVVLKFEEMINLLINEICKIYYENAEITDFTEILV